MRRIWFFTFEALCHSSSVFDVKYVSARSSSCVARDFETSAVLPLSSGAFFGVAFLDAARTARNVRRETA